MDEKYLSSIKNETKSRKSKRCQKKQQTRKGKDN